MPPGLHVHLLLLQPLLVVTDVVLPYRIHMVGFIWSDALVAQGADDLLVVFNLQ
jgi:hypothetical protein